MEGPGCVALEPFRKFACSEACEPVLEVIVVESTFDHIEKGNQTCWHHSVGFSPPCDSNSQMERPDLFISAAGDRMLGYSGHYTDGAIVVQYRELAATLIQRFVRGLLARRRVKRVRNDMRESAVKAELLAMYHEDLVVRKARFECERRLKPRTAFDAELLRKDIDEWAQMELDKLGCGSHSAESRRIQAKAVKMRNAIRIHKENKLEYTPKIISVRGSLVEIVDDRRQALVALFNRVTVEPPISVRSRLSLLAEISDQISNDEEFFELSDLVVREQQLLQEYKQPLSLTSGLRLRLRYTFQRLLTSV